MAGNLVVASDWKGPEFRRTLVGIVRKRVPECDVEDIVQATLAEALSPSAPRDEPALQRWLIGVARHKIADRHRRGRRESFDLPELHVDAAPHSEADLVRWAERELPAEGEPRRTLEWMLREGEGEKLEAIAESEKLPAPRVRKRVSRLRTHLRTQWKKELALLAALGVVAVLVWVARRDREPLARDQLHPVPSQSTPPLLERAASVRDGALAACARGEWSACLDGLDRAKEIDPAGEADDRVTRARSAAAAASAPAPVPTVVPLPSPSSSAPAPSSTHQRSLPSRPPSKVGSDFGSAPTK